MVDLMRRPVCISQVGDRFVDEQTMCGWQSVSPALLRASGSAQAAALLGGTGRVTFKYTHIYSKSGSRAARKRTLDWQIQTCCHGLSPETDVENYLKQLIYLGSGHEVGKGKPHQLQFYIIRGGAEGFLPPDEPGKPKQSENAERVQTPWVSTGKGTRLAHFDMTDLLVVFDCAGTLVNAAQLERPTYLPPDPQGKHGFSEGAAKLVYETWSKKPLDVKIRYNTAFTIDYVGFHVVDGLNNYVDPKGKRHHIWVDIHKRECTDGCIMIADPATPELSAGDEAVSNFEPQLITDVLKTLGLTVDGIKNHEDPVGKMHMVDII